MSSIGRDAIDPLSALLRPPTRSWGMAEIGGLSRHSPRCARTTESHRYPTFARHVSHRRRFGVVRAGQTDDAAPTIDGGDDRTSISTELEFHGLVYEATGHRPSRRAWRGRLRVCLAAHHRRHGRCGSRRDRHDGYIVAAFGDYLAAVPHEIRSHAPRHGDHRALRALAAVHCRKNRGDIVRPSTGAP